MNNNVSGGGSVVVASWFSAVVFIVSGRVCHSCTGFKLLMHNGVTGNGAACNPASLFKILSHKNQTHYLQFAQLSELHLATALQAEHFLLLQVQMLPVLLVFFHFKFHAANSAELHLKVLHTMHKP